MWVKYFFCATFSSRITSSFWIFFHQSAALLQGSVFCTSHVCLALTYSYKVSFLNTHRDTSCNFCRGQTLNKIFADQQNGRTNLNHDKTLCLKGHLPYWAKYILLYFPYAFHVPFSRLTFAVSGVINTELHHDLAKL